MQTNHDSAVRNVKITLTATVEKRYTEVIQVPADMTDAELNALANQRYNVVGADEFAEDPHSWEFGSLNTVAAEPSEIATLAAFRDGAVIATRDVEMALPDGRAIAPLASDILYLTDTEGRTRADLPKELVDKVPLGRKRPLAMQVYIVSLDDKWLVLGKIEVPFRSDNWMTQHYEEKSVVEDSCKRLVSLMQSFAAPGDIVFPVELATTGDAWVIMAAITVDLNDTRESISARLCKVFYGTDIIPGIFK